ncbi:AMP-binding protein [Arthrobacter sp. E3]|uniref:AMP-binding protein n=1 Tax=Arthrobacter sp. E3 TaxID=517402 RepID=UPI001A93ACA0|nr:AMP-binding protein [Arthrobacter sp. E3]
MISRPIVTGFPSTMGDDIQLNTTTLIHHGARTHGDHEIVYRTSSGGWDRYTYADPYARINRGANALRSLGVGPATLVGIIDWNSRRHFELYRAIPGLAAVTVQLNLRLGPEDLSYVVSDSGTSVICVDESLLPLAEAVAPSMPGVTTWIIMSDKPMNEIHTSLPNAHHYEDLLAANEPDIEWPEVDERSAYGACYTTGTTGRPKGVFYSHRAIVRPGRHYAEDTGPLTDALIAEGVTITNGAPVIFIPMLHYIETLKVKPDLTQLRLLSGATETTPLVTMNTYKPNVLACLSAKDLLDSFIDGYWRSGDVGTIDMENLLLSHLGIAEAAVIELNDVRAHLSSGANAQQFTQIRQLPTDAPITTSKKY